MESLEHNCANISETICPEMLVLASRPLGHCSFQNILTNPIISQINTLLLPYLISYYSSAFTINQFHNHDAEVYAPQRLVVCRFEDKATTSASPSRVLNFQDGVPLLFSSCIPWFSTFCRFKTLQWQYFELFDISSTC